MKGYILQIVLLMLLGVSALEIDAEKKITEITTHEFNPKFDHLTSGDGLPNNTINTILRDHNGFMWFGTYNGLCRYDGYDFVVYTNTISDKNSLSNNRISALMEAKDGLIYVGTWGYGLNIYDRKTNKFKHFSHDKKNANSISANEVTCIFTDSKQRIWIGTINGGLNLFNPKEGSFKSFKFDSPQYPIRKDVYSISELPDGNLILAIRGSGLCFFDVNNYSHTIFHNPNPNEDDFEGWEKKILRDKKGLYWVTTLGSGIFSFDYPKKKVRQYKNNPKDKNSLSNNIAKQILEYGTDKYLIATDGGGLNYFDPSTERFTAYINDPSDPRSLSSNGIYTLYIDNQNILWMGNFGSGVNIFDPNKDNFTTYKPNAADPNSLSNKSVLAIHQDKEENIWLGTDGGGLDLYNPKRYGEKFIHFKHHPENPNSLSTNVVKSIFQDSKGNLWMGTWNGSIERFDYKKHQFIHHYAPESQLRSLIKNISTWAIMEDAEGNIWFASLGQGLSVLNPKNGNIRSYPEGTGPQNVTHRNVSTIFLDTKNRIWAGAEGGGLMRYDKQTDGFIKFTNDTANTNSISSNDVRTIFQDSEQRMWFGTQAQGLNLFNEEAGTFKVFTEEDGLIGNSVYGILEDSNKNLWISTNKGISKFNKEHNQFTNYTNMDGLMEAGFNYTASLKAKDGRFYFGGLNGFNAFYPEKVKINKTKPNTYIVNLKLFNQDVVPGDKTDILAKPVMECSKIAISHEQSVLTIQYTCINYTFTSKNQFAYRLVGFEKEWNYVKSKREATYTNLDQGDYFFQVKASNNDGIWNEQGTTLKITVLPPFWATWWFRSIAIIALLTTIYLIIQLKIENIKRQRNELKEKVDARTKELFEANADLFTLNDELCSVNNQLKANNEEILQQKEQLLSQNGEIVQKNRELEGQRSKLEDINEEILQQKEQLINQNEEIVLKNDELEKHRYHLEELVQERTEELMCAKEKAEESDRLKSSFLANMSHEIRTPLNSIVGFSALLTQADNTPDEISEFSSNIKKSTEDLMEIMDDILDLSALEAKQFERIDAPLNITLFASHFIKHWQTLANRPNVSIDLEIDILQANSTFITDGHKINQILTALMSNACKFTEMGSITLRLDYKHGEYIFSVTDTGIGIDPKNLEVIFQKFRKVEDDRDKLFPGNGIGLAISVRLAEVLGGKLWAESQKNSGSTFYLSITDKLDVK